MSRVEIGGEARGEWHLDFVGLPPVAHVGKKLDADLRAARALGGEFAPRPGEHRCRTRCEPAEIG